MAFRRRFVVRLAIRTAWLFAATALTAWLAIWGQAPTAMAVTALAALLAAGAIWRLVNESNVELARFVAALDRDDLSQAFARAGRGGSFDRVGAAYESALARLRGERAEGAGAARFAATLVDSAPMPLLLVGSPDGDRDEVSFANKAARRLFERSSPCPLEALARFGDGFVAALRDAAPGGTRLARLTLDGLPQRVTLDTTLLQHGGQTRRIVALKRIQTELDGAELATQIDLVRVLTHEIMNSLTPVTSLSATATRVLADIDPASAPGIADAQLATAALARRAVELERFVESYKGFSEPPVLQPAPIPLGPWLDEVMRLFQASPAGQRVRSDLFVAPGTAAVLGDGALLTQVLLNLLKNAAEAAADGPEPQVTVRAGTSADLRIKLVVSDNGPGIPAQLAQDVFLPFFTTKPTGTGIGLSFARQIVLLHDGQIGSCSDTAGCIELVLPSAQPLRQVNTP